MANRLTRRLNPRLHFAAAIGWAVFGVVTAAALVTANLVASEAERRARGDAEGLLAEFATEVRDALSLQLETRSSLLQATAAQLLASGDRRPAVLQRDLEAVQAQFPEFSWLGLADEQGRLLAQTVGGGRSTTELRAWPGFDAGHRKVVVSDLRVRAMARALAQQALPAERPDSVIDFVVPLQAPRADHGEVLAAQLAWPWVEHMLVKMQHALDAHRRLEILLLASDGTVLVGPGRWLGHTARIDDLAGAELDELGDYVIGRGTHLRLAEGLGLGWTAIVRQPAELALAPVRLTQRTVFLTVFLAGLLSAAAAVAVTRLMSRRLTLLAAEAEAVRRGDKRLLAMPAGSDEVSRIGATLAQLVDHLQREKQALQTLNAELDQRVAERTQRIERMADEARHAAVTRERLRLARDLHDTLAHSLMALLTQIRLVRKLHTRLDASELDGELGRAEGVAATGLAEARSAISQMRGNGVRDAGLGPALQDLVRRFGERSGVAVSLQADPRAANWADERSETVFRIVEEALRNAERHADARHVHVQLGWRAEGGGRLDIEVADDGVGFDPARPRPGHYGLLGIHEQAALIGAWLQVHSEPGAGTRIALQVDA